MTRATPRGRAQRAHSVVLILAVTVMLVVPIQALALAALPGHAASGAHLTACVSLPGRNAQTGNSHPGFSASRGPLALLGRAGEASVHASPRAHAYDGTPGWIVARCYSPELGRFLAVDRMAPERATYGYAAGNPLRFTDPLGLWEASVPDPLAPGLWAHYNSEDPYNFDLQAFASPFDKTPMVSTNIGFAEAGELGVATAASVAAAVASKNPVVAGRAWWAMAGVTAETVARRALINGEPAGRVLAETAAGYGIAKGIGWAGGRLVSAVAARQAARAAASAAQGVVLDANVVMYALGRNQLEALTTLLRNSRRQPILPASARAQFLAKGSLQRLEEFLTQTGGRVAAPPGEGTVRWVNAAKAQLNRSTADAVDTEIQATAIEAQAPLLSADKDLGKAFRAIFGEWWPWKAPTP